MQAQIPPHLWSKGFGDVSADTPAGIAVDGSGNVLYTGIFQGTADFGGGGLMSAGAEDIFVAKFAANGNHIWSKRFGSTGTDRGRSVVADGLGNVYLAGVFTGTVNFGGSNLMSAGDVDIVIAKFTPEGNHIWSQSFGGTLADAGANIRVDSSGNVFLAANFRGMANFGGDNLNSTGGSDVVLAKYDTDGVHKWSKRMGGPSDDTVSTLAVLGTDIAITGRFLGTWDVGSGGLASAGDLDIFVAMYSDTGTDGLFSWAKRFGDVGLDQGFGAAMDSSGVAITGTFQGPVDFGDGGLTAGGLTDVFVAKYARANGAFIWAGAFGGGSTDQGLWVTLTGAGDVVATGWFFGTINFGGTDLDSAGTGDIYLVKLSGPTGSHIWSTSYGGTDLDNGIVVAVDGSNVILGGNFKDTVNFGGGGLTSAGDFDIVLLKLGSAPVFSGRRVSQLISE